MAKEPTDAIVSLLMDELRRTLEPKISHILADYQLFKETHNAVLQIPFVQLLLKQQKMCKCHEPELEEPEPIRLEIIDKVPTDAPNLDSIANYINSTAEDEEAEEAVAQEEAEEAEEEEEEEAEEEEEEEAVADAQEEKEEKEEAEEEEEEEAVAEEKEEAVADAQEEEETDSDTLELFEVEIKGKTYVTNDETNGDIYEYDNDEVGEIVGVFKNGVAKLTKKPKSSKLK